MQVNNSVRHIAIIMDGNNRWAKQRNLPSIEGHRAGSKALRRTIEGCATTGIEALTVFAFSSENWRRPEREISDLMQLFVQALEEEIEELHENGIKIQFIGDLSAFSQNLQTRMQMAMRLTASNTQMTLCAAINYGGRWDITQAARKLAQTAVKGEIHPTDIDENVFGQHMNLSALPPIDLCIRTSGEHRISNFLLWQLAYSELYFCPTLWPDFNEDSLYTAMAEFKTRQRRFGYTGEQLKTLTATTTSKNSEQTLEANKTTKLAC